MQAAEVKLWKTRIGVVSTDEDSRFCYFKYDPNFIKSGINLSPFMMPLSDTIYQFKGLPFESFRGLPGLLADVLPDRYGNALINAWLASQGRSAESFNSVERLCYIGVRGMGALEFHPDKNRVMNKFEEIEIDQLVELSNKIISQKEKVILSEDDDLKSIIKVGTSAGGVRAKAIIAYNEKTKSIKSGQINAGKGYSYWILKLDNTNPDDNIPYTKIEYAYYLMAKDARINMSDSKLLHKNNRYHFMTKRFDRVLLEDGTFDKLHMQTLGALMHIDYNEPGMISYEEVTQIMHQLGLNLSDNEQFFRRMVFNVMAQNQDDHVKNISFLMNRKGEWSLSPAYDMTYAFNPNGKWTSEHQMIINGKRSNLQKEDLIISGKAMRLKESKILEIISEVSNSLGRWEEFAKESFIDEKTIEAIKKTLILF